MGLKLAEGKSIDQAREEIGQAVEGVKTAREAWQLAQRYQVEMPIIEQTYLVLHENKKPLDAVHDLLGRDQDDLVRAGADGVVDDRAVGHRHPDRHPVELALELGKYEADRLRGAGGGGNDVDGCGAATLPVLAGRKGPGPAWAGLLA